jgi:hypothetical protein
MVLGIIEYGSISSFDVSDIRDFGPHSVSLIHSGIQQLRTLASASAVYSDKPSMLYMYLYTYTTAVFSLHYQ